MLSILAIIYTVGSMIVGLICWLDAAKKLDDFDWELNRSCHWRSIAGAMLFWPLLLFRPKRLFNPVDLFEDPLEGAARARALHRLKENMPPCGRAISFRPKAISGIETFGHFVFAAEEVECILGAYAQEPDLTEYDFASILQWVKSRSPENDATHCVPKEFQGFQEVAYELISSKAGDTICLVCDVSCPVADAIFHKPKLSYGWNYEYVKCKNGHVLAETGGMHVSLPQRS